MAGGGGGGGHGPSSGNDLSSIQLMSLNAAGANGGNIGVNSTPMMMMAALNNASVQQQNQQQHNQQQQQQKAKSRASSQSSDDMGDIPLAQLALAQAPVPGAEVLIPEAAVPVTMPAAAAMVGGATVRPVTATPTHGAIQAPSVSRTANQLPLSNTAVTPTSHMKMAGFLETSLSANQHQQQHQYQQQQAAAPPAAVIESGSSGVHSTVQLNKPTPTSPPSEHLQLQLPRPMHNPNTTDAPLIELDAIEEKLCSLLSTASAAIRIMGGGVNGSEESSGSGDDVIALKPTVKEFMVGVAEVQAGLRWQHAQLVRSRIPVRAQAAFQSDVAGVERDLVLWEDVARLLADAVDEGLAISAAATTESSA
ncbi:hypothetical protein GGF37_005576 [Kickxella alabastrina]|nr:hypothetical protein GGF37_005576 [Kickxella alabastrina]